MAYVLKLIDQVYFKIIRFTFYFLNQNTRYYFVTGILYFG